MTLLRSGRVRTIIPESQPLASIMASGSNHGLVLPVGGANHRQRPAMTGEPLRTRMVRDTDALVSPPFITMLRSNADARSIEDPLATVTATKGAHHFLTVPPFIVKNYGGNCAPQNNVHRASVPLSTVTVRDGHTLVIPYRRTTHPSTTAEPLHTLAIHDSAALVQPKIDIADCRFRTLKPREHLRAQRFPDSYIVKGNQGEQTMQAGNAVSANVAHWLGTAIAEVL